MGSERKGDYKAFGWSRRGRCCHLLRQEGLYEGERQAGAVVGVCGHSLLIVPFLVLFLWNTNQGQRQTVRLGRSPGS